MKSEKTLTILSVGCICLAAATTARADFVGVVSEIKTDAETADLCGAANGGQVPIPLTVCNVFIQFDDDDDRLLTMAFADLQVMNGAVPDVFYHHIFGGNVPYNCDFLTVFPDLICDSYVAIGEKCAGLGTMTTDGDFNSTEFNNNGHIVGGWHTSYPDNGQGDAANYPDGKVLILQSSVAVGLSLEGSATAFWQNIGDPKIFLDAVQIVCEVGCPDDYPCDDGDPCTEDDVCNNQVCQGTPIDCDDGNECTDETCDPDTGCQHTPNDGPCDDGDGCTADDVCSGGECISGTPVDCDDNDACTEDTCDFDAGGCVSTPIDCDDDNACTEDSCDSDNGQCVNEPNNNPCDDGNPCTENDMCGDDGCVHGTPVQCPKGQVCEPASGECVAGDDPCECVNGRATLCHIPPGNAGNAHTITVGCAARDQHLGHGDTCGPCADGLSARAGGSDTGSCCFTDDCLVVTEEDCAAIDGEYAGDGTRCVGPIDLAQLLGWWGPCEPTDPCHEVDADASGDIGSFDLAVLLAAWGPCP